MKKLLFIPLIVGLTTFSSAATRGDVQIINSSEGITHTSNKIMKNYLISYFGKNVLSENDALIANLGEELRQITKSTSKEETKNIVDFLAYNKNELKTQIRGEQTKEKISAILDFVEVFNEGSASIFKYHAYDFSEGEKMLMITKDMSSTLDEISIYYAASKLELSEGLYDIKLKESIDEFDKNINLLKEYPYSVDLKLLVSDIENKWKASKKVIDKDKSIFLPLILNDFILAQNNEIQKISEFHSKN